VGEIHLIAVVGATFVLLTLLVIYTFVRLRRYERREAAREQLRAMSEVQNVVIPQPRKLKRTGREVPEYLKPMGGIAAFALGIAGWVRAHGAAVGTAAVVGGLLMLPPSSTAPNGRLAEPPSSYVPPGPYQPPPPVQEPPPTTEEAPPPTTTEPPVTTAAPTPSSEPPPTASAPPPETSAPPPTTTPEPPPSEPSEDGGQRQEPESPSEPSPPPDEKCIEVLPPEVDVNACVEDVAQLLP